MDGFLISLAGKCVLITGAGGSIGSALAHAIASADYADLVLLDASEFALYNIDRALSARHTSVLGSTLDAGLLEDLFRLHRPHVVLHAAAHKHVPLLEQNPFVAIENNVAGTHTLLRAAVSHACQDFVLVSTDKAVDPSSIMGASKRVAELLLMAHGSSKTRFSAVRLGNVWGSSGSVVELFLEQIAHGGPLTVTEPEASRYFLSTEQATDAILAALGSRLDGTILLPAFGQPRRIMQIARDLIESIGSTAKIVVTGPRAGDKVTEAFISSRESFLSASSGGSSKSLRAIASPASSRDEIMDAVIELERTAARRDLPALMNALAALVPEYSPSSIILDALNEATFAGEQVPG